jgi:TonB family protein
MSLVTIKNSITRCSFPTMITLFIILHASWFMGLNNSLYGETFPPGESPSAKGAVVSDTVKNSPLPNVPISDSIPRLIKFVKADYPPAAIKADIEGAVVLDLLVSDSGTVDSVAIVKTIDSAFGSAAAIAARKFRFTPARFDGKAEPVILQYEYRFSLDEIADTIPAIINFKGEILEYGTRKKIAYAVVRIASLDTSRLVSKLPLKRYLRLLSAVEHYQYDDDALIVKADSLGRFSCRALPVGKSSVKIIAPEHEIFFEHFVIQKDKMTEATCYLKPSGFGNENEVVVYGKREETQISHHQLTPTEIRRVPGFSGNAIRVIQALPGVSRASYGSGQLMMRGSGPYDNKFFIDGIEVPFVYHMISSMIMTESVYNGQLLSKVDFYPGGFDVRYGNAIGGVVDVIPRETRTDGLHGAIELSLLKSSFVLEGRVSKKLALSGTFRRSSFDIYQPIIKKFIPYFTQMPYYQDFVARADFTPSEHHHVFFSIMGADDGMKLALPDVRGGSTEVDPDINAIKLNGGFKLYTLGSDYKANERFSNKLRLAIRPMGGKSSFFGWVSISMENGIVYSLKNTSDFTVNKRLHLYGGFDFSNKTATAVIKYTDTLAEKYSQTINAFIGGPFLGLDWKIADKLTVSPGLRYDLHYPLDFPGTAVPEFRDYSFNNTTRFKGAPALRIKAAYKASSHQAIQAMAGTYTALPHIIKDSQGADLFGDDATIFEAINPIFGKKNAQLIHGQQNVLGYTWTPAPLFSAEIQAYINNQWDVTRYISDEEYHAGPRDDIYIRDNGKARMKGVEFLLRRNEGKRFFGWISYTLSECEEYSPWTRLWSKRDWDVTNYLQLIGSYKITPDFDFGLRLRYSDGFWYTPVIGRQYYDEDGKQYGERYRFEYAQPKSKRMSPYINLDLKLEQKIAVKWATLRLSMEGLNLVNALAYIPGKNGKPIYRMPEDRNFEYNFYGDDKRINTFIPLGSLGLSIEF